MVPRISSSVSSTTKPGPVVPRLGILNALREREMSVSEVMAATGLGQANVSRHLQLLHSLGFVERTGDVAHRGTQRRSDEVLELFRANGNRSHHQPFRREQWCWCGGSSAAAG